MKYDYDRETDILTIRLSDARPDFAEQAENIITHYRKDGRPVEIEILDARHTVLDLIMPMLSEGEGQAAASS